MKKLTKLNNNSKLDYYTSYLCYKEDATTPTLVEVQDTNMFNRIRVKFSSIYELDSMRFDDMLELEQYMFMNYREVYLIEDDE